MHSHNESLSHLEYFEHWPLKCRLCKKYTKGNIKTYLNHEENHDILF